MSSDLFLFDGSFKCHSSTEIPPSDVEFQFFPAGNATYTSPDLFLNDLQPFSDVPNQFQPFDPSFCMHTPTPLPLFCSSPPTQKMHNLSLDPTTSAMAMAAGYADSSPINQMGVKMEFPGDLESNTLSLFPNDIMQRSLSSQSVDQKPAFLFQPNPNFLWESPIFQAQMLNLDQNWNFEGLIRRASSTGDLHMLNGDQTNCGYRNSFDETSIFSVCRYSPEERKQRIQKYRSKRNQRNFNKTIKYVCRKTLADGRARVRGRFARNDENEEILKATDPHRGVEEEEEPWVTGLHEEEIMAVRTIARGMNPPSSIWGSETLASFSDFQASTRKIH